MFRENFGDIVLVVMALAVAVVGTYRYFHPFEPQPQKQEDGASRTLPWVGNKSFFISSGMRIGKDDYPSGVILDMEWHPDGKSIYVITKKGEKAPLKPEEIQSKQLGAITTVKWDVANNLATGLPYPWQIHKWYFLLLDSLLFGIFDLPFGIFLFSVAFLVFLLVSLFDDSDLEAPFRALFREPMVFVVFLVPIYIFFRILYGLGSEHVHHYHQYLTGIETYNQVLESHKMPSGHLPPFRNLPGPYQHANGIVPYAAFYVPIIVVLHFAIYPFASQFVKAVLYLVLPHPAAKHLENLQSSSGPRRIDGVALADAMQAGAKGDPPPASVSEVYRRKAQALAQRLRADRQLMEEVIEREKTRTRLEK